MIFQWSWRHWLACSCSCLIRIRAKFCRKVDLASQTWVTLSYRPYVNGKLIYSNIDPYEWFCAPGSHFKARRILQEICWKWWWQQCRKGLSFFGSCAEMFLLLSVQRHLITSSADPACVWCGDEPSFSIVLLRFDLSHLVPLSTFSVRGGCLLFGRFPLLIMTSFCLNRLKM